MKHKLAVFASILSIAFMGAPNACAQVDQGDSLALVALYNATNGPGWANQTSNTKPWLQGPVDQWWGVVVKNGRVTGLFLGQNWLKGSLPSEIGNLTALDTLYLGSNLLSGAIPPSIGNLTNLSVLYMPYNQLTGTIPSSIWSLTKVTDLDFGANQLTGTIPDSIGNLTRLTVLSFGTNQLTGSIPSSIGSLTKLTFLSFGQNQLTGTIPNSIGNLINLTDLWLQSNQLTGAVPVSIGNLTALLHLYLQDNQLTGTIPASIGNLTKLTDLELHRNQLSGSIPNLAKLAALQILSLGGNGSLSGSIPAWIPTMTSLTQLYLWGNQLSGTIPTSIGNLTNLAALEFSENQLTGSIPNSIGNSTNLTDLSLFSNQLNGTIPSQIGNLTKLTSLDLYGNQLTGAIPAQIGNLTNLTYLGLGANQLSGMIPAQVANLKNLQYLSLFFNQLSGSISIPFFEKLPHLRAVVLSHNALSGSLADDLAGCDSLFQFSVDHNNFSGSLPSTLADCPLLKYVFADSNQFSSIPDLSSMPLDTFLVYGNQLTFGSLEPNVPLGVHIIYSPQDSVPLFVSDAGSSYRLWVSVSGNDNVYSWFKSNAPTTGSDSAITIPKTDNPADYQCQITSTYVTGLTLYTLPADGSAGVSARLQGTQALRVFPNPSSGEFHILRPQGAGEIHRIELLDDDGRVVADLTHAATVDAEGIDVKTSRLAPGTYFVRLTTRGGGDTYKIVVTGQN